MYIRVASVVYGDKYFNMYFDSMLASLSNDIARLRNEEHIVDIVTYKDFMEMIRCETLASEREGSYMFFSPADIIWSENTLYNLSKQIDHLNCGIAVPHFRVNDGFLCELPINSKTLFKKALKYAHVTFTESFDSLFENQCHWGFSVRQISENVYTMRHNMPHVAMIKLIRSDCDFFERHPESIAQWDRDFLNKLHSENRLKIVGNNIFASGVELTNCNTHMNDRRINKYDDAHCNHFPSNALCRSTIYVMEL